MVSDIGQQAGQDSNSWEKENKWGEINIASADCLEWASSLRNKKEEPNWVWQYPWVTEMELRIWGVEGG